MSNPINLLQEQIQRAEALTGLPNNSPQYKIWCDTTARILRDNFTSEYVEMFNKPSTLRQAPALPTLLHTTS